jgi:hypothetical protein
MIRPLDNAFVELLATKMFQNPGAAMHVSPWLLNIVGVKKKDFDPKQLFAYSFQVLGGNHSFGVRAEFVPCNLLI